MRLMLFALTASLLLVSSPSSARIYKCLSNDGSVSYSQSECNEGEVTDKILSNRGIGESRRNERESPDT